LTAEVIMPPRYPFPDSSSLLDINLTIGILDEFFWFRLPIRLFPLEEYASNKVAKDQIKKK